MTKLTYIKTVPSDYKEPNESGLQEISIQIFHRIIDCKILQLKPTIWLFDLNHNEKHELFNITSDFLIETIDDDREEKVKLLVDRSIDALLDTDLTNGTKIKQEWFSGRKIDYNDFEIDVQQISQDLHDCNKPDQ